MYMFELRWNMGYIVQMFECFSLQVMFAFPDCICIRIILGACKNNYLHQCCKRIKNENYSFHHIEELQNRVHLLSLLWASVSEEFQVSSFFFIHMSWEGFEDMVLKLDSFVQGWLGILYIALKAYLFLLVQWTTGPHAILIYLH